MFTDVFASEIAGMDVSGDLQFYEADKFPVMHPVHWLTSHFAVGGWSPLRRLSGMLTAHMTQIAPRNGFTWHPHRGLEIFTYVIDGTLYHEDSTGGKGTISAGEVQRMFSGNYIEHQELNRSDDFARVIQIWFVSEPQYMGLEPHYEQIRLDDMPPRQVGDGVVRDIIGPQGATNAHVAARLTSTLLPAGGSAKMERPESGENLFLYFVDGNGTFDTLSTGRSTPAIQKKPINLYDVVIAKPEAETAVIQAGDKPLNYLSFYLKPFMN